MRSTEPILDKTVSDFVKFGDSSHPSRVREREGIAIPPSA